MVCLLSSYTYQCLIGFKFVTEIHFVAQRTKQFFRQADRRPRACGCILGGEGGGALHYMAYIGMCGPKGYGFSAVLVRNRESILAILVSNRVCFFLL